MRKHHIRTGFIAAGVMNIGGVLLFSWSMWHANNNVMALYSKDLFAGTFFSIYGLNDLVFMMFFAWVFFSAPSEKLETR